MTQCRCDRARLPTNPHESDDSIHPIHEREQPMIRRHYRGDDRHHQNPGYRKLAKAIREAACANPSTRCWRCGYTLREHRPHLSGRPASWNAGHTPSGGLAAEASTCNVRGLPQPPRAGVGTPRERVSPNAIGVPSEPAGNRARAASAGDVETTTRGHTSTRCTIAAMGDPCDWPECPNGRGCVAVAPVDGSSRDDRSAAGGDRRRPLIHCSSVGKSANGSTAQGATHVGE